MQSTPFAIVVIAAGAVLSTGMIVLPGCVGAVMGWEDFDNRPSSSSEPDGGQAGGSSARSLPDAASDPSTGLAEGEVPDVQITSKREIFLADIDGDNRADLCGRRASGISCLLSNGKNGFDKAVVRGPFGDNDSSGLWKDPLFARTIRFADVNGDGKIDVCGRGSDGFVCARSNAESFLAPEPWNQSWSSPCDWDSAAYLPSIQINDVNRDNLADICGLSPKGVTCGLSDGTSFAEPVQWSAEFTSDTVESNHLDMAPIALTNVDGKPGADLCFWGIAGIRCAASIGSRFDSSGVWGSALPDHAELDGAVRGISIVFGDVSGDGADDVCGRVADGIVCASSLRSSFQQWSLWSSVFRSQDSWSQALGDYPLGLGDIDGDGASDLCASGPAGVLCSLSTRAAFQGAAVWTSDFGTGEPWD